MHKDRQSLIISNLFVRSWNWPEDSMVLHQDSEFVFFVVECHVGFENVEPFAVEETDKLPYI